MSQIVYTASTESQQIHVWQLQKSGTLALIQIVEVGAEVQPLIINTRQKRLYAGVRPDVGILTFQIDNAGKLIQIKTTPLAASATHLSLDNAQCTLFVAHYHDGLVSVFPLDTHGIPVEPTQVIDGLAGCHSTNVDLSGRFLFAPALKQDRIAVMSIDPEGKIEPQHVKYIHTACGAGPRHMAFHPLGHYAYVINELDSTLLVIKLDEQAFEITATVDIMPADFVGTRWAADIHITPDGHHLYACDRTSSLITHFAVDNAGAKLSLRGHHPTEQQPRGFNIDVTGQYLIAVGQHSGYVASMAIDQEKGSLTLLERHPAGKGPMWVAVHRLSRG